MVPREGCLEVVKVLLGAGADPNLDRYGSDRGCSGGGEGSIGSWS